MFEESCTVLAGMLYPGQCWSNHTENDLAAVEDTDDLVSRRAVRLDLEKLWESVS